LSDLFLGAMPFASLAQFGASTQHVVATRNLAAGHAKA
jgi:hypothetical protein